LCLYTRVGSAAQYSRRPMDAPRRLTLSSDCSMGSGRKHARRSDYGKSQDAVRAPAASITRLLQLIGYRKNMCERHRRGSDPDGARAPYFTGAIRCW